jgi:lipopolysaccharide/colanic/teichoic acid biosynthesis glycosyltransferase
MLWLGVHEGLSAYLGLNTPVRHLAYLSFASLTCLMSLVILQGSGYFGTYRIVPRNRDLVILVITICVSSLAAKYICATSFHFSLLRYRQLVALSFVLGLIAFGFQSAYGVYLRNNARRSILLLLLPEEEMRLRSLFREHGLNRGLRMVSFRPWLRDTSEEKNLDAFTGIVSSSAALKAHFSELNEVLIQAHLRGLRMAEYETVITDLELRIETTSESVIRSFQYEATFQSYLLRSYTLIKAVLEPLAALLLLTLLSPIILAVVIAIRATSEGPVFYSQQRVGLNGKLFSILKFRSMLIDAEKNGPMWASASKTDSRLTPIGAFLRSSHLDEIPQLWNIVRGEVSFIGPRPERPEFCEKLNREIPLFPLRTLVRPGITGWAQVWAGYANSIEDSRTKLEYDLFYINRLSPWTDVIVVVKTIVLLLSGGTEGKKLETVNVTPGLKRKPRSSLASRVKDKSKSAEINSATL